ncbi:Solute carrier family 40 protein [Fusarium keratoplasticum]|uniref:Solute carrier family 40 protein n=1 Tax=Fusarium keratoplasticum TaxID=1328300 RepID=A0ACC0QFW7_9HYPO|nr:Solute carrier family 40 protein [Fusarium keratoplasticum]KAI8652757.1 Solute carrier family 40 protein [Fusarium keratoplasticum]
MQPNSSINQERIHDERSPLLAGVQHLPDHRVPASIARRLYLSHFLSTWNSRVFEFGAVLYMATIFPGTLMPMSVYAFVRGLSAIAFAPAVGMYIDTGNRLQVARVSIVFQRVVVAASCAIFYILLKGLPAGSPAGLGLLLVATLFACIEKLCSIMNLVSVEKDWVVVVAEKDPEALRIINAQMRRIDLLCKLLGPLFIALIDGYSSEVAIVVNFAMNAASVVVEYFAIARVYWEVPELQRSKQEHQPSVQSGSSQDSGGLGKRSWQRLKIVVTRSATDFYFYFNHRAFLPSFAGAMLYFTVLSFAGQMVTYLLSAGYSSMQIGFARTLSVVFEVLATWFAPWLMGRIGVVRAGLWLSASQVITLAAGFAVFWICEKNSLLSASGLVVGTILSRLGLRGFDLCIQLIVQEDVEAESRGAFSSVEAAWQNAFELLSYASTILFYHPNEFKWPSLLSVAAVISASVAYTIYVYLRRGHLLHLELLTGLLKTKKAKQAEHDRGISRITSTSDV